jgi:hypothetical protein
LAKKIKNFFFFVFYLLFFIYYLLFFILKYAASEAGKKVKFEGRAKARAPAQFGGQFSFARKNQDNVDKGKGVETGS